MLSLTVFGRILIDIKVVKIADFPKVHAINFSLNARTLINLK